MKSISKLRTGRSLRESSYDRSGGNKDYFTLMPRDTIDFATIDGAGYITHIWITMAEADPDIVVEYLPRKVVLRAFWDGADTPSIEVPIGDFFGMGHGITKNHSSVFLSMSPQEGKAFNSYFPMPYAEGARFQVENESDAELKFYFYVDYEQYPSIPDDELRFHAVWNRECPTEGIDDSTVSNEYFSFGGKNTDGKDNFVLLEAHGCGHYVGCNYNIHNLRQTREWNWYGEGDDMIFIDGKEWPPALHGTGTEDYFNTSWCPDEEQQTLYHGIILPGGPNWSNKISCYRYHFLDPVIFEQSIKVTIEHGHNNHRSDDISSTAYWYQKGINPLYKPILKVEERLPLPDIIPQDPEENKKIFSHPNP